MTGFTFVCKKLPRESYHALNGTLRGTG